MSSTIVRGRYVVSGIADTGEAAIIENGALRQQDGFITDIGKFDELSARFSSDTVVGSGNQILIPGLVNAHHHIGLTPLQRGVPDRPLELWYARRPGGRVVSDLYLDTLYSAFEMVESGVTTVQHLVGWLPGGAEQMRASAEDTIRAYKAIGMRVSYSFSIIDQNSRAYIADEDLPGFVPAEIRESFSRLMGPLTHSLEDYFGLFESLHDTYQDSELARIQLAPANLHWCSDEALERVCDYSDRFDVPMHMHLVESAFQKEYARRRTGGTAISHLNELGLLNPRMTVGHSVWANGNDIEMLAESGAHVCHNCSSNFRLRSGMLPLMEYLKRGIPVGIGIDEAGLNDDRDMLQEMRLVLNVHRPPGLEESDVPSAAQVFRMATESSAGTTGFDSRIGTLEVGKSADMVLIDWQQLAFPYLDNATSVIDALVYRGKTRLVDTVLIAGNTVYHDGKFTGVDRDAALQELANLLDTPVPDEELKIREIGKVFETEMRKFYSVYLNETDHVPWHAFNSRF
jgi:5-methylthioadenosine/S-adenosylhomocysteine deaminase